jgi:hypothetical protein
MASARPVVVRAVLIGSDGTADESETLELQGCLVAGDRPDRLPWRMWHRRGSALVCETSLTHAAEGWALDGEDCDAPVRHLALHALRPGEYLTLLGDGGGSTFRIVNVTATKDRAERTGTA